MMADFLNLDNEAFGSFLACGSAVILKMLFLAPMTSVQRRKHKAWTNPEDAKWRGREPRKSEAVERVRRCHQNDLENIPAFLALGAMYLTTDPAAWWAIWHFRVFLISRVLHTVCYLNENTPGRGLSYLVGQVVNVSMALQILYAVFS